LGVRVNPWWEEQAPSVARQPEEEVPGAEEREPLGEAVEAESVSPSRLDEELAGAWRLAGASGWEWVEAALRWVLPWALVMRQ
jgi:hypothetical protein